MGLFNPGNILSAASNRHRMRSEKDILHLANLKMGVIKKLLSNHHQITAHTSHNNLNRNSIITCISLFLLIFSYITSISFFVESMHGDFIWMHWMNHFMAGFLLL